MRNKDLFAVICLLDAYETPMEEICKELMFVSLARPTVWPH